MSLSYVCNCKSVTLCEVPSDQAPSTLTEPWLTLSSRVAPSSLVQGRILKEVQTLLDTVRIDRQHSVA